MCLYCDFGAALILGSDVPARTLPPPQELPIGIVTSLIGGLFVVAMLLRSGS
ncbi:iron chelate uptake ABC transporter family permease subunit [Allomesorhizobium alhagi]|uniref:iron chelate uptake ABC transporter family permease subunit n=1 Tax=Allomesorhizobium alhagi TaxID=475067 RepID=UPI000300591C